MPHSQSPPFPSNSPSPYGPSSFHFRGAPSPSTMTSEFSSRMSSDTGNPSLNISPSPSLSQTSTMGSIGGTSTYRRDRLLKRAARRAQQVSDGTSGEGGQPIQYQMGSGYLSNVHIDQENDLRRGMGMQTNSSSNSITGSHSGISIGSAGSGNIQDLGLEAEMLGVLDEEDLTIPEEEYVGPADLVDDMEAMGGDLGGSGKEKKKMGGFKLSRFGRKKSAAVVGGVVPKPSLGDRTTSGSTSSSIRSNNSSPSFHNSSSTSLQPKPILKSALNISNPSTTLISDCPSSQDPLLHRGLRRYPSSSTGTSISSRSGSALYQPSPLGEARGGQQHGSRERLKVARGGGAGDSQGHEAREIGFLEAMEDAGKGGKIHTPETRVDGKILQRAMAGGTGLGITVAPTLALNVKQSHTTLPKLNVAFPISRGDQPSPSAQTPYPSRLDQLSEFIVHGSTGIVVVSNTSGSQSQSSTASWVVLTMRKTMTVAMETAGKAARSVKHLSASVHVFTKEDGDAEGAFVSKQGKASILSPHRLESSRLDITRDTTLVTKTSVDSDKRILTIATAVGDTVSSLTVQLGGDAERSEWVLQLQTVIAELSSEHPAQTTGQAQALISPLDTPIGEGLRPAPRPVALKGAQQQTQQEVLLSYTESMAIQAAAASPDSKSPRPAPLPRDSFSAESIQWNVPISNMRNSTGPQSTSPSSPASTSMKYVDPIDGKTYSLPPSIVGAFMANDDLKKLLSGANSSGETVDHINGSVGRRGSDNSTESGGDASSSTPVLISSPPTLGPIVEGRVLGEEAKEEEMLTPLSRVHPARPNVLNRASTSSSNTLTFGPIPGMTSQNMTASQSTGTLSSVQTMIMTPPMTSDASDTSTMTSPEIGSDAGSQNSGSIGGFGCGASSSGQKRRPAWKERAKRMKEGGGGMGHGEGVDTGLCIMSQLDLADPTDPLPVPIEPILASPNITRARSISRHGSGSAKDTLAEPSGSGSGGGRRKAVVRFAE